VRMGLGDVNVVVDHGNGCEDVVEKRQAPDPRLPRESSTPTRSSAMVMAAMATSSSVSTASSSSLPARSTSMRNVVSNSSRVSFAPSMSRGHEGPPTQRASSNQPCVDEASTLRLSRVHPKRVRSGQPPCPVGRW
jgi:hypothetical protein